jgi:cytochrome c
MDSGMIKNIIISLGLALGLVIVVNVIGELSIRPDTQTVRTQPKQTVQETKAPETEVEAPAKVVAQVEKAVPADLASLLAAYTAKDGSKAFRKCKACHTSNKDGANRVGPNLWDVLGSDKGAVPGFRYSDAMKLKGGTWTYGEMDQFLANPRIFVRGTKMSLKGFSDPALRASLIGFLRSLSDNPKPLPQ